jgi:hypothetical protein
MTPTLVQPAEVQPVDWPTVKVGTRVLTFRMSYAASFQLQVWDRSLGNPKTTDFDVAAACAGQFDAQGNWHSLALSPIQFADLVSMQPNAQELSDQLQAAAVEAVKKVNPGLAPFLQAKPGSTAEPKKTDGSGSGPSESLVAASA